MNKKIFFLFLILSAGCFTKSYAPLIRPKTDVERTREEKAEQDLQRWIRVYNELVGIQDFGLKTLKASNILRGAQTPFFKKSFGKYKKGLKNEIGKIAKIAATQKLSIINKLSIEEIKKRYFDTAVRSISNRFLMLIDMALGHDLMKDTNKYKKFVITVFEPEIIFFVNNMAIEHKKDLATEIFLSALNHITEKIRQKVRDKFLKAMQIEACKRILGKLKNTTDIKANLAYINYLALSAPKSFFRITSWRNKRTFYKHLAKTAKLASEKRERLLKKVRAAGGKYRIVKREEFQAQSEAYDLANDFLTTLVTIQKNKKLRGKKKFIETLLKIFNVEINLVVEDIATNAMWKKTSEMEVAKEQIDKTISDGKLKNRAINTIENEISIRTFKELKKTTNGTQAANMIAYLDKHPPKFAITKRVFKWFTRKTYKRQMKKLKTKFAGVLSKRRVQEHISR
jgi:hypothetical protein